MADLAVPTKMMGTDKVCDVKQSIAKVWYTVTLPLDQKGIQAVLVYVTLAVPVIVVDAAVFLSFAH